MAAAKQVAVFAGLVLALLVSVPGWANQSAESGPTVGPMLFDHPNNLRHPAPGFVIMDPKPPFGYFSPALFFNKPYTLAAGALRLNEENVRSLIQ